MLENEEDEEEAKRMYLSYTTITIISCDLLHLTILEPVVLLVLEHRNLGFKFPHQVHPGQSWADTVPTHLRICSKKNMYKYWVQNGCVVF